MSKYGEISVHRSWGGWVQIRVTQHVCVEVFVMGGAYGPLHMQKKKKYSDGSEGTG